MQWFLFFEDIFVKSRRKFSVRMKNILLHYVIQHGRPHNSRFIKEGVGVHQQGRRFDLESGGNMKYNIVTAWIFSSLYCLLQFYIIYLKNKHLLNIHILISYMFSQWVFIKRSCSTLCDTHMQARRLPHNSMQSCEKLSTLDLGR